MRGVEELHKSKREIVNPIKLNDIHSVKVSELCNLSEKNKLSVKYIVERLSDRLSASAEYNLKKQSTISEKTRRARKSPQTEWFDVEHIRDALRFRATFNSLEELKMIMELLIEEAHLKNRISNFIKFDMNMIIKPKAWGWRAVVVDIRHLSGQIVEFYCTFPEIMEFNNSSGHELYEKWRDNFDPVKLMEDPTALLEYESDIKQSDQKYRAAYYKSINELGLTDDEFQKEWNVITEQISNTLLDVEY